MTACSNVSVQHCDTVDTEVCQEVAGAQVCVEEVQETCTKVPHEDCQVVQEQVCDDPPSYLPPQHQPQYYKPKCRTVDRRVCQTILIEKCVHTPTQKCSPGPPETKCEVRPMLQCADKVETVCVDVPVSNVTKKTVTMDDTMCSTQATMQCQPRPSLVCSPTMVDTCVNIPVTSCSPQPKMINKVTCAPLNVEVCLPFPVTTGKPRDSRVCVPVTKTSCSNKPAQSCTTLQLDVCKNEPEVPIDHTFIFVTSFLLLSGDVSTS